MLYHLKRPRFVPLFDTDETHVGLVELHSFCISFQEIDVFIKILGPCRLCKNASCNVPSPGLELLAASKTGLGKVIHTKLHIRSSAKYSKRAHLIKQQILK